MKTKCIPDKRYSITREWVGLNRPVWVIRFCGEWLRPNVRSYAFTRDGAITLARTHRANFLRTIAGRITTKAIES